MRAISAVLACLLVLLCSQCTSPPPKQEQKPVQQAETPAPPPEVPAKPAVKPPAPQPPPKTMTKLVVRLESSEMKLGSYAAQPRTFYRAGTGYCRVEEADDPDNDRRGVVIMNEPHVWLVNLVTGQGRHLVSPGSTRCRLPIFTLDDVKSAPDLRQPLLDLEFGRELQYFKKKAGEPQAGPVLQGKPTNSYTVKLGDAELLLYSGGTPEVPLVVILKKGAGQYTYAYDSYTQLPFDAKLFSKPEGMKIREPIKTKQKPGKAKKEKSAGSESKDSDNKKPDAQKPPAAKPETQS